MKKGHKIRRYGNIYSASGSNSPIIVLAMVAGLAVFSLLGWTLYPLAYDFVSNFDNPANTSNQPGEPAIVSPSQHEPTTSAPQLPVATQSLQTGIYVPTNLVNDSTAFSALLETAKQSGATYVLVDAKDVSGMVHFASSNPIAIRSLAVSPTAFDAKTVATQIRDAGLVPVARIHAFRDNTVARANREMAVGYYDSTYVWLDNSAELGGRAWLNPYEPASQNYVIDIALELSNAGFQQVMLDSATFPLGVGLDKAGYGSNTATAKNEVIRRFVTEFENRLSEAKAGTIVHLSDELLFAQDYIAKPEQNVLASATVEAVEDSASLTKIVTALKSRVAANGQIGLLVTSQRQDGSVLTTGELDQIKKTVAAQGASICFFYNLEGSYSLQ